MGATSVRCASVGQFVGRLEGFAEWRMRVHAVARCARSREVSFIESSEHMAPSVLPMSRSLLADHSTKARFSDRRDLKCGFLTVSV